MIRAIALLSGGKDSVYAIYLAQQQCIDVQSTLSIVPNRKDSLMFHVPNISMASVVSSAMGLPNITIELGEGEDELKALSEAIRSQDIDAVVTGAIASDYQAFRINMVCEPLDIKVLSPLWHKNEESFLREMCDAGFRTVVVGAFAEGIESNWLGRFLDLDAIDHLVRISQMKGIYVSGEGGEIETLTIDGPNFEKALEIVSSQLHWERDSGFLQIHALRLLEKR